VRKTQEALGLLEDLLAVELLLARDVLTATPTRLRLGIGAGSALNVVEAAVVGTVERTPAAVHSAVRASLSPVSSVRRPAP
jgi:histidine ammonia-lyase